MKPATKHLLISIFAPILLVALLYSGLWGYSYYVIQNEVQEFKEDLAEDNILFSFKDLKIEGFPGQVHATLNEAEIFHVQLGVKIDIPEISLEFWPLPGRKASLQSNVVQIKDEMNDISIAEIKDISASGTLPLFELWDGSHRFKNTIQSIEIDNNVPFLLDRKITDIELDFKINEAEQFIHLNHFSLLWRDMTVTVDGSARIDEKSKVQGQFSTLFDNYAPFLEDLKSKTRLPNNIQIGLGAVTLLSQEKDGIYSFGTPLTITDNKVRLGVFELGVIQLDLSDE